MNMAVDASGRNDHVLARNHFGRCAHDQIGIDAVHGVGISGLTYFNDAAVADPDVAFYNAPMVDDNRVGDDEIENAADCHAATCVLFCPMPSRMTLPPPKVISSP